MEVCSACHLGGRHPSSSTSVLIQQWDVAKAGPRDGASWGVGHQPPSTTNGASLYQA